MQIIAVGDMQQKIYDKTTLDVPSFINNFLEEYDIDACLWMGVPGDYGMNSVAKILTGEINPSGKLSDTYAYDLFSSPAILEKQFCNLHCPR